MFTVKLGVKRVRDMLPRRAAAGALALVVAAAASLGVLVTTPANANHLCPDGTLPVHFTPPADPALAVWDVEGKITGYDRGARTMTAIGMTMTIPPAVLIKTLDLDQPVGNISLDGLTDPTLESARSIVGGTVIAGGAIVFDAARTCMTLTANSVFVELAENGLIGLLMSVDVADGSFMVNGATIRMNNDPRFASDLLDIGGNKLDNGLADLVGWEGSLVAVGGYYDATVGVLYATLVETEVLTKFADRDTVAIEKAQGRAGELRVIGLVSRHPTTGLFADSVEIVGFGTAPVDPASGTFDFRLRRAGFVPPASVTVNSPNGGSATADVTIR